MKDKLVKTGKTKAYFIRKTVLLSFIFVILALIILALPIGVTYGLYLRSAGAKPLLEGTKSLVQLGLSNIGL